MHILLEMAGRAFCLELQKQFEQGRHFHRLLIVNRYNSWVKAKGQQTVSNSAEVDKTGAYI